MIAAAINWYSLFFFLFAGLACGFAFAVLFSNNVVRMAFYLIISLAATAGLFMLAGAQFVGAMQIMIYVGGTLVLLIFGVMLTARATFVSMKTKGGEWVLAGLVGGALFFVLAQAAVSVDDWVTPRSDRTAVSLSETEVAAPLGQSLIGVRVDKLRQDNDVLRGGMSGYLLPFELIAMHLLVVLIGSAYLARAKRRVASRRVHAEALA
jgi:NADH-quinone oxidoreductase subunit J